MKDLNSFILEGNHPGEFTILNRNFYQTWGDIGIVTRKMCSTCTILFVHPPIHSNIPSTYYREQYKTDHIWIYEYPSFDFAQSHPITLIGSFEQTHMYLGILFFYICVNYPGKYSTSSETCRLFFSNIKQVQKYLEYAHRQYRDVTGASFHAPIQSSSMYVHTIRWSIYDTI